MSSQNRRSVPPAAARKLGLEFLRQLLVERASPQANLNKEADVVEGRGIAFRRHFDTFIALVAEVRVHRKTGVIEPVRYVCAHECGLIVNPETLTHVIERQLVYGTGRTTVLQGIVHLVIFAAFLFFAIVP